MDNKNKRRIRFEDVAGRRVQTILSKLDLLSNCSNRHNYEFDDKDVQKMFSAIKERLKITENKFLNELNTKNKIKFNF